MPATDQLTTALRQARLSRHQPDCRCGKWRDSDGGPYCTADEWRWETMINRLITKVLTERVTTGPAAQGSTAQQHPA